MEEILINWSPQETRVAIVENGAVQELHLERELERGLVGNIYLGKVARVLPGMQSAFVDIGLEKAGFLHLADVWRPHADVAAHRPPVPIERQIFQGQALMVQVIKDPISTKGARLATQVSIAGRALVLLPQDEHIGVSTRIESHELREALRARVKAIAARLPGDGAGFILRTNAEDASDAELEEDVGYLRKTWAAIRQRAQTLPAPALLYRDLDLPERVLRDMTRETVQSIRIDAPEQYEKMLAFGREYMPAAVEKLELFRGDRPIFDHYAIEDELEHALARRVDLKSGGDLIIDQTEAMTTIDVNTGAFVGTHNFDETIFKTNLEAADAIARQLRLRNLGGIIIVDFIDMARPEHREQVMQEFRKRLAHDPVKTSVNDLSPLGLVEMTRKRTRESLARMVCETCPVCGGRGQVKTARTVCYEILREILREARQFNPREFRIIAAPKVVETFLDEESQHLAGLSETIGKPVSLQAETAMSQEQYDIVLR